MTSSAAPSSRPTRSADIESIITIIAWGAQVVSVIVSNHVLDASTLVPPSFTDSSSPDAGLNLVSLVRTMNSAILILAVIGFITAFYVVAADNKMGGAVLSAALAGTALASVVGERIELLGFVLTSLFVVLAIENWRNHPDIGVLCVGLVAGGGGLSADDYSSVAECSSVFSSESVSASGS